MAAVVIKYRYVARPRRRPIEHKPWKVSPSGIPRSHEAVNKYHNSIDLSQIVMLMQIHRAPLEVERYELPLDLFVDHGVRKSTETQARCPSMSSTVRRN
jgi:hypothetical protein